MGLYEDFVERINANPKDMDTRLIYADWLEDVDPALAEAWRVITEMNRVPTEWPRTVSNQFSGWNWFSSHTKDYLDFPDTYPRHWRERTAEHKDDLGICGPLYPSYPTAFEALTAYAEVWITAKELDLLDHTMTFRFTTDSLTKVNATDQDAWTGDDTDLRIIRNRNVRDVRYTGLIYEPTDLPNLVKAIEQQCQVRVVISIDDPNLNVSSRVIIRSVYPRPDGRLDIGMTTP